MNPLTYLNYDLDLPYLLTLAENIKQDANPYKDPRYEKALETWKILKYTDPYIEKIMKDFNIEGSPRFYWQEANSVLPMHTDNGTTCSINFVLTEDPAPITIEDKEYYYKQALLDTTRRHGVTTQGSERILLKISIFDTPYETVAENLPTETLFHE